MLLYFLKLKRTPLEVPSTLSVAQVDRRPARQQHLAAAAHKPAAALAAPARAAGDGRSGAARAGAAATWTADRYIFLIDNSASMQARDVAPSRLEEAKRRAGELDRRDGVRRRGHDRQFSDSARVEQVFTDNRRELERQLAAIRPTERTTSLEEALRVAAGYPLPERRLGGHKRHA